MNQSTGKYCKSELSGKIGANLKMHLCRVHKQIYNEICEHEKEKTNLARKCDGKRVVSAGLSTASAFTNRISASVPDVLARQMILELGFIRILQQ